MNQAFNIDSFQQRRRHLMQSMGGGVAVIPTAPVQSRNGDVEFQYRPDSDFYYLTGFNEPGAVAVLCPGRAAGEYILFCREKDPDKELWYGRRAGLKGAVEEYGADDAFPIEDLDDILPRLLEDQAKIFASLGRYNDFDAKVMQWMNDVKLRSRRGVHAPHEMVDLSYLLHEQRLIKTKDELAIMRKAGKISAQGHSRAMQSCQPGMTEQQVQAEMEYIFRKGGSTYNAYPSIVAGGENSCILHYIDNNNVLNDGDLLLIDAGAELDCYASDISRTFPVNGKFSGEQKALYEIVLAAQKSAFDACIPGAHWNEFHDNAVEVITEGLVDVGLLQGELKELIETNAYRDFYMHRTGHWLGMDVHDVGDYQIEQKWRVLEPGMVFTVEPGIYVGKNPNVDSRWHDIGIRIEDDVVIKKSGHEVLTNAVPTAIDDIEHLMSS